MTRGGGRGRACTRKVAHPDRPSAHAAMSRLANERGVNYARLHIYRCPYKPFPHWHVGHVQPRKTR